MSDRAQALKAPFPAFGGKSKVAPMVWDRLGDVDNFVEPFCNSAAVLLNRPHAGRIETVNDWDCYVANFWRATAHDPEAVAVHADNPVNEADLHARHRWLVLSDYAELFRRQMRTDPTFYDVRVAGWWVWGACCWIGSGWCPEPSQQLPHLSASGGQGLSQKLPHLDAVGRAVASGPASSAEWNQVPVISRPGSGGGVHQVVELNGSRGVLSQKLPELNGSRGDTAASAEWQQKPRLADEGNGVNVNHRPQLADAFSLGRGVNAGAIGTTRPGLNHRAGLQQLGLPPKCAERQAWLQDWFLRLRDRFRTVRVCCGDWIRVCDSPSTTTRLGLTGLFLDPPYRTHLADGKSNRSRELYASDRDQDVNGLVDRVIAYCLECGDDPQMRIAVCCYEGEGYEVLAEQGWTVESWKASGGYGNQSGAVNDNAARERIWFSPACVKAEDDHPLFAGME